MQTTIKFQLKDSKPGKDFIEWNNLMSKNYNQDEYYEHSHPFIVWVEKKRLRTISQSLKRNIESIKTIPSLLLPLRHAITLRKTKIS